MDEIEEVEELFAKRSSLPDPTAADAPALVQLTHDHSAGNRADATITVGFANGVAGYSSGDLNIMLGSTNTPSPLLELFGIGDANDYLIESVYWGNEDDITEFEYVYLNSVRYTLGAISEVPGGTVWLKRIVGYPTGLALATISINFQRFDGTWYFNDSADELLDAGLYQLTDDGLGNPIYDIIPRRGITHRDSVGPPAVAPTRAGVIDIDDLGRVYAAAGQVHRTITPPTGTTEVVPSSELGTQHVDNVAGFADLADRGGLGAWFAEIGNLNFIQVQALGPPLSIDLVSTFHDVYIWIINNVAGGNTAANRFFRDDTTMLGLFSREQDALQELQFVLSGEAFPAVTTHQYLYVNANHTGAGSNIRRVTAYNPGQFLRDDDFHWNDQADKTFVATAIAAHAAQSSAHHVKTPSGGGGGGGTVETDATLDGDGSTGDPLRLADDAVTTAKIIDGAVTTAKMGPEAVTEGEMGNLAVTTAKIADDAVTHPKLAPNSVHGDRIQAAAITTAKIADGAVESDKIGANAVVEGKLPIDNTLAWDGSGQLSVNVTDVIDSLNETVEYYSDETGNEYDDGGHASMGEDYDTSAHRHIIHKVQIDINGADTTNGFWRAGVFAIDAGGDITAVLGRSDTEGIDVDQRHTFVFPNPVEVPASQRIRILGSRVDNDGESGSGTRSAHLSRGDEETASPRESYDDAHLDFARIRHVRVNHAFPDVGDTTHDHGADSVRGDIKIYYTVKLDHGDLVGDGNVNAAHLDSGSAPAGNVATADGSGNVTYAAPGDAASVDGFSFVSLTQAEYDALTPDANTVYLVTA